MNCCILCNCTKDTSALPDKSEIDKDCKYESPS